MKKLITLCFLLVSSTSFADRLYWDVAFQAQGQKTVHNLFYVDSGDFIFAEESVDCGIYDISGKNILYSLNMDCENGNGCVSEMGMQSASTTNFFKTFKDNYLNLSSFESGLDQMMFLGTAPKIRDIMENIYLLTAHDGHMADFTKAYKLPRGEIKTFPFQGLPGHERIQMDCEGSY